MLIPRSLLTSFAVLSFSGQLAVQASTAAVPLDGAANQTVFTGADFSQFGPVKAPGMVRRGPRLLHHQGRQRQPGFWSGAR